MLSGKTEDQQVSMQNISVQALQAVDRKAIATAAVVEAIQTGDNKFKLFIQFVLNNPAKQPLAISGYDGLDRLRMGVYDAVIAALKECHRLFEDIFLDRENIFKIVSEQTVREQVFDQYYLVKLPDGGNNLSTRQSIECYAKENEMCISIWSPSDQNIDLLEEERLNPSGKTELHILNIYGHYHAAEKKNFSELVLARFPLKDSNDIVKLYNLRIEQIIFEKKYRGWKAYQERMQEYRVSDVDKVKDEFNKLFDQALPPIQLDEDNVNIHTLLTQFRVDFADTVALHAEATEKYESEIMNLHDQQSKQQKKAKEKANDIVKKILKIGNIGDFLEGNVYPGVPALVVAAAEAQWDHKTLFRESLKKYILSLENQVDPHHTDSEKKYTLADLAFNANNHDMVNFFSGFGVSCQVAITEMQASAFHDENAKAMLKGLIAILKQYIEESHHQKVIHHVKSSSQNPMDKFIYGLWHVFLSSKHNDLWIKEATELLILCESSFKELPPSFTQAFEGVIRKHSITFLPSDFNVILKKIIDEIKNDEKYCHLVNGGELIKARCDELGELLRQQKIRLDELAKDNNSLNRLVMSLETNVTRLELRAEQADKEGLATKEKLEQLTGVVQSLASQSMFQPPKMQSQISVNPSRVLPSIGSIN